MSNSEVSRREVLSNIGAAGFGALAVGAGNAAADEKGEYNVGTASPAAERAARDAADDVVRVLDWEDGKKTVTGTYTDEAIENLEKRPDVRYTEVNGEMHAISQSLPWGIDRVDAEVAHVTDSSQDSDDDGDGDEPETGGDDGGMAHIAIIDTGIDDDHPDLNANIADPSKEVNHKAVVSCGNRDCVGQPCKDDTNCTYPWSDDNDHGTHVSGIANAEDNSEGVVGVSTEAVLHSVKVLDCHGCGSYSGVAEGIKWVGKRVKEGDWGVNYAVANMSLGGSHSSTVKDALDYAYDNGVLLVGAAGNDGPCTDCVGHPAAEPEVIAVSATTKNDSLADFSSQGPEVELAAPGKGIYSSIIGGYDTFSGTSMAAPHVAGSGAQLLANGFAHATDTSDGDPYPTAPGGARGKLQDTAEDIGLSSAEQGEGLVDTAAALGLSSSDNLSGTESSLTVSTGDATNIGTDSATLNGTLDDLGGADSAEVYFEYGESGTSLDQTSSSKTLSSTGSFSIDISGLSSGTDYDYRAVADASDGDSDTGTTKTFTTDSSSGGDNPPTIVSWSATSESPNNPHAEIKVNWDVSDTDGDLDTVKVTVEEQTGDTETFETTNDVSGSDASGSNEFKDKFDSGEYKVTLKVTDSNNNSTSDSTTITA